MKRKQHEPKTNPRLRAAFLEVVANQLKDNDPPETRQTLERLKKEGMSEKDARICIAQVVAVEVYEIMKHKQSFNRERFVRNLNALPEEPGT